MGFGIVTDLECAISASHNEDGTNPIPNGGAAAFHGAPHTIWLHFTTTMKGSLRVRSFKIIMAAGKNGSSVHNAQESVSMTALASPKTFSVPISFSESYSNEVDAFMVVDPDGSVPESSTLNNFAGFKCSVMEVPA